VTEFTYRLHPPGPTVLGGLLIWDQADAREAMRRYARFCLAAPDAVDALGVLLTGPAGAPLSAVSACAGPIADGEQALKPLRERTPRPMQDAVGPVAYTTLQASADGLFLRGWRYDWSSHFPRDPPDAAIDVLMTHFAEAPSPLSKLGLQQLGGAIARVPGRQDRARIHADSLFARVPRYRRSAARAVPRRHREGRNDHGRRQRVQDHRRVAGELRGRRARGSRAREQDVARHHRPACDRPEGQRDERQDRRVPRHHGRHLHPRRLTRRSRAAPHPPPPARFPDVRAGGVVAAAILRYPLQLARSEPIQGDRA
jgi:hypothetical protein